MQVLFVGLQRGAVIIWLLTFVAVAEAARANRFQSGDLIFHKSLGPQGPAIEEAQGSPYTHVGILFYENNQWMVYEAVQPVKRTPLRDWLRRGRNGEYLIRRMSPDWLDMSKRENQLLLKEEVKKYIGYDYDIFFQWSDDAFYCSELAYKAYRDAFGVLVGGIQKVGDLDLTGPNIRRLIEERERLLGEPINYEEPIITPKAMLESGLLMAPGTGLPLRASSLDL